MPEWGGDGLFLLNLISFFLPSAWSPDRFKTFKMFSTALLCLMPSDSLSRMAWTSGLRFLPFRNWTLSLPKAPGGLTADWSGLPVSPGLLETACPEIYPTLSGLRDFFRTILILLMPPLSMPPPYFMFAAGPPGSCLLPSPATLGSVGTDPPKLAS